MTGTRIAIDGLWRCLCPSFDAIVLSQLKVPIRRGAARPSIGSRKQALSKPTWRFSTYSTTNGSRTDTKFLDKERSPAHIQQSASSSTAWSSAQAPAPSYTNLDEVPIAQLHETLRGIRTQNGAYNKIVDLVTYLINSRREKPSLLHYDALIRANADAAHGSAAVVAHLLREMKQEGVVPDSGVLHSALQVRIGVNFNWKAPRT